MGNDVNLEPSQQARPTARITIAFSLDSKTSFAHQQNGIPFIRDLKITNDSPEPLEDIELVISSDPEFTNRKTIQLQRLGVAEFFTAEAVDVPLSGTYLSAVQEATVARVTIEALSSKGLSLGSFSSNIQLLAFDQWAGVSSLPEILAAFSQPNHPAVERILRSASELLSANGKQSSLEGYQSRDRKRVWEIVSAIYGAVANLRLTYSNPPASFEHTGQKIRTPDRILESRLATCLDLCMLLSSAFEQAGLHPVILMKRGHSFAGVWLSDDQFSTATVEDLQAIRKQARLGDLVTFETTLLTGENSARFDQAVERANAYLSQDSDFELAVDVHRARLERIFPLPIRTQSGQIASNESTSPGLTEKFPAPIPNFVDEAVERERSSTQAETPAARLDRWKRKLLDLSLRNRLLNFRPSRSTVPILCADPATLEDTLAEGKKLRFRSIASVINPNDPRNKEILQARYQTDALKGVLEEALIHSELYSDLSEEDLNTRLTEIYRSARTAFEEGGANTLFLAFGFLCWSETAETEKTYKAPLILVPVTLERKSVQHGFSLSIHDDEARVNASLLEMLRQDFELEVPGVDPLPTDESGIHVAQVWQRFRRSIRDIPRWEVQEDVSLGLFSFAKYLMWKDLQDRADDLKRSPVVQHLIDHPGEAYPDQGEFPDPETLDDKRHPVNTFAPLVADSSQLSAVFAAADGKSFVLDGPPGTGKSQTICNIIAQCLSTGRTVLFVSEKMAALEVVQRRLKQIGLERFCLQLHSAKAKKTDVIEHLGATWTSAKLQSTVDWQRESEKLAKLRDELNEYVRELHRQYPNGLTPFCATAKIMDGTGLPDCEFTWSGASLHDSAQLDDLREIVATLVIRAAHVGVLGQSQFLGITADQWSPSWEKDFKQLAELLRTAAVQSQAAILRVMSGLNLPERNYSWNQIRVLDVLSSALLDSASIPSAAIVLLSTPAFRAQCSSLIDLLKKRNAAWRILGGRYDEAATSLPLAVALQQLRSSRQDWWPKSWIGIRRVRKSVSAVSVDSDRITPEALERDLVQLMVAAEQETRIGDVAKQISFALGQSWRGKHTDPAEMERLVSWGKGFGESLSAAQASLCDAGTDLGDLLQTLLTSNSSALAPNGDLSSALIQFREAKTELEKAVQTFAERVPLDQKVAFGSDESAGAVANIVDRTNRWTDSLPALRNWCSWNEIHHKAVARGLNPIVNLLKVGLPDGCSLETAFEHNYCKWWISEVLDAVPVLCKFVSQEHERKIDSFVKADERFASATKDYLTAMLSQRIPRAHVEPGSSSELGLLAREMNKKSRHISLRTLVQKMPTVLSRLTPCMMMSPMSVAQYLDAAHPPFDVVVFDEASQIPVWDAIGAIARGSQLIVAGDPKQLPPTNFFSRTVDQDSEEADDAQVEELESILDECNAIKLAPQHLKWHYRSRNESLIAFSNRAYYGNRLITFPSPVTQDTAVTYHGVNGIYDRSASRTNRAEADAVVAFVVSHLKAQNGRSKDGEWQTIGVVTFNAQQQNLIEDLLDAERQKFLELEPYFSKEASEYVLVKNLENVQGDERDVMVFSTTYGQDASGKRSMNFGPLNRDGGERRLNVAITRARVGLHLFSSIGPEHIDLSRTRKRGAADLKHFLEYAQRGPKALSQAIDSPGEETESIFEDQVCEMLRTKGWTVHPQVGCSGYRIDLGVVDPRAPGRYLLGVECDGAMYHRAATARDRDRLRAMVLRGLGWRLHRIWSTDWWANPERELAKIDQLLTRLLQEDCPVPVPPDGDVILDLVDQLETEQTGSGAQYANFALFDIAGSDSNKTEAVPFFQESSEPISYRKAVLQAMAATDDFYAASADSAIRSVIVRVIAAEAPIADDVLVRRVSESWGFARTGNRIRQRVLDLVPRSVPKSRENGTVFFWPEGTSVSTYSIFRINPEAEEALRDVKEICTQELANLLLHVIKVHAGVSQEQAIRDACKLLGIHRLTEKVADRLGRVTQELVKSGAVTLVGESLV